MDCVISDWPNWIQAGVAVGLLVLTYITLMVLRDYAADTKRIADISASQTENSQMPLLAVVMRENAGGWHIENQGFGPALNIVCIVRDPNGQEQRRTIHPIGKDASREFHLVIAAAIGQGRRVELEYESLSGLKYRTVVEQVDGGLQTRFHKPAERGVCGARSSRAYPGVAAG